MEVRSSDPDQRYRGRLASRGAGPAAWEETPPPQVPGLGAGAATPAATHTLASSGPGCQGHYLTTIFIIHIHFYSCYPARLEEYWFFYRSQIQLLVYTIKQEQEKEVAMVGPSLAESDTRCLHTCNLLDAERSHVADASHVPPPAAVPLALSA